MDRQEQKPGDAERIAVLRGRCLERKSGDGNSLIANAGAAATATLADAPEAFLRQISEAALAGHNNFALLNNDILIPACVRAGRILEEARLYVNGGCQETMVEGIEHSAGTYYYFNLARAFDLTLRPEKLAAAISAFAKLSGPTLQLNCVWPATLREAQLHPEKHQDLIVRISGLSALFVALQKEVQDEIINRAMMAA